jgi:hypothetical protein
MKPANELSLQEARTEVEESRSKLAGNEYLAPKMVPKLKLSVRAIRIQLRLAQSGTLLGVIFLVLDIWLAAATSLAWAWFAVLALPSSVGAGIATYHLSKSLAFEQQLLDGWRDALIRTEASTSSETLEELNVYRIRSLDVVDELRRKAHSNRRMHNILQILIIVGSITITSLTSIGADEPILRWAAVVVAASVSIAAGVSGFFKYRERGQNQQRTADAIEKELHHLQLGVGAYAGKRADALKRFAVTVEALREDQRKAELQLDQTSVPDARRLGQAQP